MRYLHYRRAKWGYIDSAKFPQQLKDYNKTDLEDDLNTIRQSTVTWSLSIKK